MNINKIIQNNQIDEYEVKKVNLFNYEHRSRRSSKKNKKNTKYKIRQDDENLSEGDRERW